MNSELCSTPNIIAPLVAAKKNSRFEIHCHRWFSSHPCFIINRTFAPVTCILMKAWIPSKLRWHVPFFLVLPSEPLLRSLSWPLRGAWFLVRPRCWLVLEHFLRGWLLSCYFLCSNSSLSFRFHLIATLHSIKWLVPLNPQGESRTFFFALY